jgi:hypothetical protein
MQNGHKNRDCNINKLLHIKKSVKLFLNTDKINAMERSSWFGSCY